MNTPVKFEIAKLLKKKGLMNLVLVDITTRNLINAQGGNN